MRLLYCDYKTKAQVFYSIVAYELSEGMVKTTTNRWNLYILCKFLVDNLLLLQSGFSYSLSLSRLNRRKKYGI